MRVCGQFWRGGRGGGRLTRRVAGRKDTRGMAGTKRGGGHLSGKRLSGEGAGGEGAAEIYLGTSSFTAAGWEGSFYPAGMKPAEYLTFYATKFDTVEVDSTFYRTPSAATVNGWERKTPGNFVFAVKVPQTITHEKILVDCEGEFREFVSTMELLGPKLGPMVLQFPYFNRSVFTAGAQFLARLKPFLEKLPAGHKFAVEIRNKNWLDAAFAELLRKHGVALVLQDQSWMPLPGEFKFDAITADFTYIRWLGDRKGIEKLTTTWDKVVVDRTERLGSWVDFCQRILKRGVTIFAYANNHYAGHAPSTIAEFLKLWNKSGPALTAREPKAGGGGAAATAKEGGKAKVAGGGAKGERGAAPKKTLFD
jgi:uncharacterized protein YecE (DUF72 family)